MKTLLFFCAVCIVVVIIINFSKTNNLKEVLKIIYYQPQHNLKTEFGSIGQKLFLPNDQFDPYRSNLKAISTSITKRGLSLAAYICLLIFFFLLTYFCFKYISVFANFKMTYYIHN